MNDCADATSRPQCQTLSSAHRITPVSIPPLVYRIAALRASKMWMRPFLRLIHLLSIIRLAQRLRASSRMHKAQRRAHPRRPHPPLLEGGEVYRQHGEEEGYLRVVAQREAPLGGVGLREGPQEAEEEA